jgi:hypothetical protein
MVYPCVRILTCTATAVIYTIPAAVAGNGIYRCEVDGVATYQDRPCDKDSVQYEPDAARVSTYAPPAAASPPISAPRRPRKRAAASIAQAQAKRAEECRRIAASLQDIKARTRAGYNAKEGERMRARKTKLDERRRAHKCG